MDWNKYIHSDNEVLLGKPIVKGTRLSVDFILGLFAEGWDVETVIKNYPSLNNDIIKTIFAYAAETVQDELYFNMPEGVV